MVKVLFLSRNHAGDRSAYSHRIHQLKHGIEKLGIRTGILYLGEKKLTSHTMLPLYVPWVSKILREYDFIHAGGTPCAFVASVCKVFHRRKIIYDVHGDPIGEILQEKADPSSRRFLGYFPVSKAFFIFSAIAFSFVSRTRLSNSTFAFVSFLFFSCMI